jgi:uncharacterized protein with PQ loop repeat
MGILATVLISFHLVGLIENTGSSVLLGWMANPESINNTSFLLSVKAVFTLFAVGGVVIGLFFSQKTDQVALISFVLLMIAVADDILAIYGQIKLFNADLALLIFSPILLLYILTGLEWWRNQA